MTARVLSLGRIIDHDERSKGFSVGCLDKRVPRTIRWARRGPCLDQGDLGACTAFATLAMLSCEPFVSRALPFTAEAARHLYSLATKIDRIPGAWPPTDTGSSGLAACKAAKKLGLVQSYHHAFGLLASLRALLDGPVIAGVNWYEGFDTPVGQLAELVPYGGVRGGHEVMLRAVDVEARLVFGDSSWGPSWGNSGGFALSFATLERLLSEKGDVTTVRV